MPYEGAEQFRPLPHLLNGAAANDSYQELKLKAPKLKALKLKALSTSSSSFSNYAKVVDKISSPSSWKMIVKTIPLETLFPVSPFSPPNSREEEVQEEEKEEERKGEEEREEEETEEQKEAK